MGIFLLTVIAVTAHLLLIVILSLCYDITKLDENFATIVLLILAVQEFWGVCYLNRYSTKMPTSFLFFAYSLNRMLKYADDE